MGGICAHTGRNGVHDLSAPSAKVGAHGAHRLAPPPAEKGLCWGSLHQKNQKSHFFVASVASFWSLLPTQRRNGYIAYLDHCGKLGPSRRTDWLRHPLKKGFVGLPARKTSKDHFFGGSIASLWSLLPTQGRNGCIWSIWTIEKVKATRRTDWLRHPPSKRALLGSLRTKPKKFTFSRGPSRVYGPTARTEAGWAHMAYLNHWAK